jgi:4-aminobutyrate aminotransferase-like enzyme
MKVAPLGVNSNFRFWGEGATLYMDKAKGAYLWDVDGKRYIDYRLAFGPIILGHSYDDVDTQVIEEIRRGTLAAMTYELEIALMEKIVEMCPAVEMARLACSGTEATMHAIRVARAYTGGNSSSSLKAIIMVSMTTPCGPRMLRRRPMAAAAARSRWRPVRASQIDGREDHHACLQRF